ncbi:hypothetical protein C4K18_3327 [Pseudomonas chlororaphis subsp. aurantiaca]|nr:hypothetical protein C4K18_3327 [Pseudomonas chlororaphis subsp. aurantiaca]
MASGLKQLAIGCRSFQNSRLAASGMVGLYSLWESRRL